jgi:hypothetical protein
VLVRANSRLSALITTRVRSYWDWSHFEPAANVRAHFREYLPSALDRLFRCEDDGGATALFDRCIPQMESAAPIGAADLVAGSIYNWTRL